MAAASPSPTLTCPECSFVNEAERVYCHNCGSKLDRSVLPKPEEATPESIEKARKRVQKITNPNGSKPFLRVKTLFTTLIYAFLVAGLVQLLRPPADLPLAPGPEVTPRMISSELTEALEAPESRTLQYTEPEVNGYLVASLRSKAQAILPGAKFERAYARLEPGNVHLGLEQSILGVSLHFGTRYQIGVEDGKFVARNQGGNFGRIAVHPLIMKGLSVVFSSLFGALKREDSQVQQMKNVTVEKGRIILVTKGKAG